MKFLFAATLLLVAVFGPDYGSRIVNPEELLTVNINSQKNRFEAKPFDENIKETVESEKKTEIESEQKPEELVKELMSGIFDMVIKEVTDEEVSNVVEETKAFQKETLKALEIENAADLEELPELCNLLTMDGEQCGQLKKEIQAEYEENVEAVESMEIPTFEQVKEQMTTQQEALNKMKDSTMEYLDMTPEEREKKDKEVMEEFQAELEKQQAEMKKQMEEAQAKWEAEQKKLKAADMEKLGYTNEADYDAYKKAEVEKAMKETVESLNELYEGIFKSLEEESTVETPVEENLPTKGQTERLLKKD